MFNHIQNSNYNPNNSLKSALSLSHPSNLAPDALPIIKRLGMEFKEHTKNTPPSIDECLISDDEIKVYSLLRTKAAAGNFPDITELMKKTDEKDAILKLTANFIGPGLLTGGKDVNDPTQGGLDGFPSPLPNFMVWEWLLNDLYKSLPDQTTEEGLVLKNLIIGIKQLKEFSADNEKLQTAVNDEKLLRDVSMKYALKVRDLQPGQSQMFYGGWTNQVAGSGHALVYEIAKKIDGKYEVLIYTSTGFELGDSILAGNKTRLKPLIRYTNIPEEILLFNKDNTVRPGFIQSFIELIAIKTWDLNRVVSEEDVLRVFDYLHNYRVPVSLEECGAVTGQRSGDCVPASTKKWIRRHSHHIGLYKQIMFHLTLRLLITTYHKLKAGSTHDTKQGELIRRKLCEISRNLLRKTAKLSDDKRGKTPLVDEKLALQARATAHDILKEMDLAEAHIAEERKAQEVLSDLTNYVDFQRALRKDEKRDVSTFPFANNVSMHPIPRLDISIKDRQALEKVMEQCYAIESFKQLDWKESHNLQIQNFVDKLPLPKISSVNEKNWVTQCSDPFWDKQSAIELAGWLKKLEACVGLYQKSYMTDFLPRRFATILPLYTLIHYLAIRIDSMKGRTGKAALENHIIPSFSTCLDMEGIVYFDRKEFSRIQEAKEYFEKFNDRGQTNHLFANEADSEVLQIGPGSVMETPNNGAYWQALLQNDKKLDEAVLKKGKLKFPDLLPGESDRLYNGMLKAQNEYNTNKLKYDDYLRHLNKLTQWNSDYQSLVKTGMQNDPKYSGFINSKPTWNEPIPDYPGSPPPPAKRQVDLSDDTKRTLIMESAISEKKYDDPLFINGYGYIHSLRRMVYKTREWVNQLEVSTFDLKIQAGRESFFTPTGILKKTGNTKQQEDALVKSAMGMQRVLSQPQHEKFFSLNSTKRDSNLWGKSTAEGNSLVYTKLPEHELLYRLYRTTSQWELTPNQLIYELSNDFESLKDPSLQALFYRLFFRSPINSSEKTALGVGELILNNPALIDNAKSFIAKGLNHFSNSPNSMEGARFFFELSFYLAKYLTDADHPAASKFILSDSINKEWLTKKFKEQELSSLYLYNVLFLSLKPEEKLSKSDYADFYSNWVLYKLYPIDNNIWKSPVASEMAHKAATVMTDSLKNKLSAPDFCQTLGNEIFKRVKLPVERLTDVWTIDKASDIPYIRNGNCAIDLVDGCVYTEYGKMVGLDARFPWEQQDDFKRLFGNNKNFTYRSLGDGHVSFTHPTQGSFVLMRKLMGGDCVYVIQRHSPSSKKVALEYQKAGSLDSFPTMLDYDHCYWAAEKPFGVGSERLAGYITTLKQQRLVYGVTAGGRIIEVDSNGMPKKEGYTVDYLNPNGNPIGSRYVESVAVGIERFEDGKNLLCFTDDAQNLEKVSFPRYVSQDGNPLTFVKEKGKLVWVDNRQYTIPKKMPKAYLGTIENYIYLEPIEEKPGQNLPRQMLVPFQPLIAEDIPVANGRLATENKKSLLDSVKPSAEQQGLFQYFVYQVEKGEVKPVSLEGKLFLAHIYQSQKRYQESIELLRSLKPTEFLSPTSMKILEMITDLPNGQDHPDGKMVVLKAYSLIFKEKDKKAVEPIRNYFETEGLNDLTDEENAKFTYEKMEKLKKIEDDQLKKLGLAVQSLSECLQAYNRISSSCRMSWEEEEALTRIIYEEGLRKQSRIEKLLKFNLGSFFKQVKGRLELLASKKEPTEPINIGTGERKPLKTWVYHELNDFVIDYSKPDMPSGPFTFQTESQKTDYNLGKDVYERNNSESKESADQRYQQSLANYQYQIQRETDWLQTGYVSTVYTRLDSHFIVEENGQLFLEVYKIAKNGSSSERNDMLLRLLQWKWQMKKDAHLDLLIQILSQPDNFPKATINKNFMGRLEIQGTPEEIYQFLKKVEGSYSSGNPIPTIQALAGKPEATQNSRETGLTRYPVNMTTAFDVKPQGVDDILNEKIPVSVTFPKSDERWNQLTTWKKSFLKEDPSQVAIPYKEFSFTFNEDLLTEREQTYKESIKQDLLLLQKDYDAGKSENEKNKLQTISQDNCQELFKQASVSYDKISNLRKTKEAALLSKFNAAHSDELKKQAELARLGGRAASPVNFNDCVTCLLSLDKREFQLKNENINQDKDAKELADLTLEVLDLKSQEAQLKRIVKITEEIEEADKKKEESTRRYLCQKLDNELKSCYHFEKFVREDQVALRVFAGETGLIPFEKQTDLIKKMIEMSEKDPTRFRDIVIQLIMGGGKTSVIATILLYLASQRKDRIPLFLVPTALYQTVKVNFSEAMQQAFKKDVLGFIFEREDLTVYKLKQFKGELKKAKEQGLPIVMNVTSLQCLELELLSQARGLIKVLGKIEKVNKEINDIQTAKQYSPESIAAGVLAGIEQLKVLRASLENSRRKLELLSEVVEVFPNHSDALLDEVDILLDCLQEVNFPDGDDLPVVPVRNSLLHKIYEGLISAEIKVSTLDGEPSLAEVVRLNSNEQTLLMTDGDKYIKHVVPTIAQHISTSFAPITKHLANEQQGSFVRYVTGTMAPELEGYIKTEFNIEVYKADPKLNGYALKNYDFEALYNDWQFLRHLQTLYNDGNERREAANLIALTKHFLLELVPATLSKSGGRNYGPTVATKTEGNATPGKMIPYLGVNTPATTEFGYHWEAAAYYYQWAAAFLPDKEQILEIARLATDAAKYYIQKNGEKFEETAEYLWFFNTFGVKVDEIEGPDQMKIALETLAKDPKKRLNLQYETVSRYVTFRSERLTSNGLALLDQLGSRRTMSGTPWNVEGYDKRLAERYEADIGTVGKIHHKLATRIDKNEKIYEVDFKTVDEFLEQLFDQHPYPEKIRGIIDAGGLFKGNTTNAEIAEKMMKFLAKKQDERIVDKKIEGVLFFHTDEGETQPNTLYVWKKGAKRPDRIGGSSIELLKSKGLDPSKYFTFYDERHTTGTDILQLPDAVNPITFDEEMIRRTFEQGAMRLRQLLSEQDVDVVVTREGRQSFVNGGKTLNDLILNAEKRQSIRKTQAMIRYFTQQIYNVFRREAVKKVREALANKVGEEKLLETITLYEKFFVTTLQEEPFKQHGKLKPEVDTKAMLQGMLTNKLEEFTAAIKDAESVKRVTDDVAELKGWIEKATSLPKNTNEGSANSGVEQEVSVHQQKHQEIQLELAVEAEVEQEFSRYQMKGKLTLRQETRMNKDQLLDYIAQLRKNAPNGKSVISLKDQLKKYKYKSMDKNPVYKDGILPYDTIFNQPIFGTDAYFHTYENTLASVFDKGQKPPKQVLVVRGDDKKIRWLMLSEHEARDVSKHLKEMYKGGTDADKEAVKGIWLMQPNETLLVNGEHCEAIQATDGESISEGLIEINAFAGNIDYLDQNTADTESWMMSKGNDSTKLRMRFLKVRTFNNKVQNQILRRSHAFVKRNSDSKFDPNQQMFLARVERERSTQGKFHPANNLETKLLGTYKNLRNLNVQWVPLLGIDVDNPDPLSEEAMKTLGGKEEAIRLTKLQFSQLCPFQVAALVPEQMKWLPPEQVEHLERPEQIYKMIPGKNGQPDKPFYALKRKHVAELDEKQKALIPYLNPKYYGMFKEKWQIEAVPPQYLDKIDVKYWNYLTNDQVKRITREQFETCKNIIPLSKWKFLHGNLLPFFKEEHFSQVCQDQIREITDPTLIPKLEEMAKAGGVVAGKWTEWIAPKMVEHIHRKTQLQYLTTSAQIQKVKDKWVKRLDYKTQVPLIGETQVRLLVGGDQIQHCPDAYVFRLNGDQLPHLSDRQVPFLRDEQISWIKNPDLFSKLKAKDSKEKNHVNQMPFIREDQYQWVTEKQIKGLSKEQLLGVKEKQEDKWIELQKKITKEQVQSFDSPELISLLTAEQINQWLESNQVAYLTEDWQIQACPEKLVKELDPITQVPKIKKEQVKGLEGANQIQACPKDKEFTQEFVKSQFRHLTDEQFKDLSAAQIGLMNCSEEVNKLSQEQWIHLAQAGVKSLDDEKVKLLQADDRLRDKVPFINIDQVPLVSNSEAVKVLSEDQLAGIASDKFLALDNAHPLWTRVPGNIVKFLGSDKIATLAKDKLQYLENETAIRSISFWDVQHLTREQLAKRDWNQFIAYTVGVIALGVVSSIITLIAHATLIPLAIWLIDREKGRSFMAKLHENPIRLYRYFEVYSQSIPEALELVPETV